MSADEQTAEFKVVDIPTKKHPEKWEALLDAVAKLEDGKAIEFNLNGDKLESFRSSLGLAAKARKLRITTLMANKQRTAILIWKAKR